MTNAPERIWAYNNLQTGYRFTAKGPQPHFDGVEYIRADLMTELVDAAEGVIPAALYYGGLTDAHLAAITRLETIIATVSKAHQIKETTK